MDTNKIIDSYTNWLNCSIFSIEIDNGYTEIVTPFLDSHNDLISIYVKSLNNGKLLLTDGGDTIGLLDTYGVDVTSKDAYILLERLARATSCEIKDKEICVIARESNVGFLINQLAMAIMRISGLTVADL